jgi:hypothetical protein
VVIEKNSIEGIQGVLDSRVIEWKRANDSQRLLLK